MLKKWRFCVLMAICLLFVSGCYTSSKYLEPVSISEKTTIYQLDGENGRFIKYEGKTYDVSASLCEYQGFYVVDVEILNKTKEIIKDKNYFIWLVDGRDLKPFGYFDKEALKKIKLAALASSNSAIPAPQYEYVYQGKTLNTYSNSFSTSYQTANVSQRETDASVGARLGTVIGNAFQQSALQQAFDKIIDNSYSFRPLYPNEARDGYLCFYPNFDLDYPLFLLVGSGKEKIMLKFMPQSNN